MTQPETVADVTAEMRRFMPNTCTEWADRIDRAMRPQPDTLRDWFAGHVIMGYHVNSVTKQPEQLAREAYAIADAMLAERAKGGAA